MTDTDGSNCSLFFKTKPRSAFPLAGSLSIYHQHKKSKKSHIKERAGFAPFQSPPLPKPISVGLDVVVYVYRHETSPFRIALARTAGMPSETAMRSPNWMQTLHGGRKRTPSSDGADVTPLLWTFKSAQLYIKKRRNKARGLWLSPKQILMTPCFKAPKNIFPFLSCRYSAPFSCPSESSPSYIIGSFSSPGNISFPLSFMRVCAEVVIFLGYSVFYIFRVPRTLAHIFPFDFTLLSVSPLPEEKRSCWATPQWVLVALSPLSLSLTLFLTTAAGTPLT